MVRAATCCAIMQEGPAHKKAQVHHAREDVLSPRSVTLALHPGITFCKMGAPPFSPHNGAFLGCAM